MKTKKKFQSKRAMRLMLAHIEKADDILHTIRDHFDMEWGENSHCDLDVNLMHVLGKLIDAKRGVQETLDKYKGKGVTPHFPRKKAVKKAVTVGELQKAMVC